MGILWTYCPTRTGLIVASVLVFVYQNTEHLCIYTFVPRLCISLPALCTHCIYVAFQWPFWLMLPVVKMALNKIHLLIIHPFQYWTFFQSLSHGWGIYVPSSGCIMGVNFIFFNVSQPKELSLSKSLAVNTPVDEYIECCHRKVFCLGLN